MKDVQTMLSIEEFVSNMVLRGRRRLVAMKDVTIMSSIVEFAKDMGQ